MTVTETVFSPSNSQEITFFSVFLLIHFHSFSPNGRSFSFLTSPLVLLSDYCSLNEYTGEVCKLFNNWEKNIWSLSAAPPPLAVPKIDFLLLGVNRLQLWEEIRCWLFHPGSIQVWCHDVQHWDDYDLITLHLLTSLCYINILTVWECSF